MAKLMYSLKICLLEDQIGLLPARTITTCQQVQKICEFAHFAALVYIPWWLKASDTCFASSSDFLLYQLLDRYAEINPLVSRSVLHAFTRHLWFLNS